MAAKAQCSENGVNGERHWPHHDSCADLGWKFYPDHWNIWIINVYKKKYK